MSSEIGRWETVASSLNSSLNHSLGFPGGTTGKESACQCRRCKRFRFDPWVGKMPWNRKWQTHSRILAWSIPWAERPGRAQSMGSQRVRHDWARVCTHTQTHTQTHKRHTHTHVHTHTHTHTHPPSKETNAVLWSYPVERHTWARNPGQRSVRVWDLPRTI